MVDLLRHHHESGRRFELLDATEDGDRVVVRLAVTLAGDAERAEVRKAFTFSSDDRAVLLEDLA